MTLSITVRNIPQETRDVLAARAARSGRSLQEYLRLKLVELAARPSMESVLARATKRKAVGQANLSTEFILAALSEDRQ